MRLVHDLAVTPPGAMCISAIILIGLTMRETALRPVQHQGRKRGSVWLCSCQLILDNCSDVQPDIIHLHLRR